MDLGTDKEMSQEILRGKGSFNIIKNLKERRKYQHRILSGGFKVMECWYPTIRADNKSGELKGSWNAIMVSDDEDMLLTPLIHLDEEIKNSVLSSSNISGKSRSRLTPNLGFLYLIFDRGESEVKIDVVNYKYSVAKAIALKERAIDPEDSSVLLHGPSFCWDALIEHTYDAEAKGTSWQKHKFTVEVYGKTAILAGKVPADIWERQGGLWSQFSDETRSKLFTSAELQAIEETDINLSDVAKPLTNDEIMEELAKFPINPFGVDQNGVQVFANPKEIFSEMNKLRFPLPSKEDIKLISENVPTATNADFEVVDEKSPLAEIARERLRPAFAKKKNPNLI